MTVHLDAVLSNFLQYPELRPYFYHGVDERSLDDESRLRVETLAEIFADVLEGALFTTTLHPETDSYDDWAHYSRDVLVQSPCLRRMISEHSTWWSLLYDFLAPLDIAPEPSTQQ